MGAIRDGGHAWKGHCGQKEKDLRASNQWQCCLEQSFQYKLHGANAEAGLNENKILRIAMTMIIMTIIRIIIATIITIIFLLTHYIYLLVFK